MRFVLSLPVSFKVIKCMAPTHVCTFARTFSAATMVALSGCKSWPKVGSSSAIASSTCLGGGECKNAIFHSSKVREIEQPKDRST